MNTKRIFVERRRIRWIMIVRENILLCNNREFIKILYPHPSKTGLLETLYIIVQWQILRGWSCPYHRWGEKFKLWWSGWMIDDVLARCALIDDWETQQSITVEEMSEKGRPSCYNSNSSQCEWDIPLTDGWK